jgi:signal transduction histidine kinase
MAGDGHLGRLAAMRVRLTALAVVVVGTGLAMVVAGVTALVHQELTDNIQAATVQRAHDISVLVGAGRLPEELPPAADDQASVQVVVDHRHVVSASAELRGLPPILSSWPVDHPVTGTVPSAGFGDRGPHWVYGLPATVAGEPGAVYAAGSLAPVREATRATLSALLVAVPVLLVVLGVTVWLLVGRALRPVVEAGERQRRFVSDASHELRSPLATIRTRAEVGLAHPDAADWPAVTRDVHREATRLGRLVDELLMLSAADGDGLTTPADGIRDSLADGLAAVDLDELVLLEVDGIRARGRVDVDLSRLSAVRVPGHAEQLRAVVRNLLDNAERHAERRVSIELGVAGEEAELVVHDDGRGIDEADRERVFDRFSRLDPARDRGNGGAGLGLAIVRAVVTGHGGRVWVADTPTGAEVHVRLPAGPDAV